MHIDMLYRYAYVFTNKFYTHTYISCKHCIFIMCLLHIYVCRQVYINRKFGIKVHFYPCTPLSVILQKIQNCASFIINDIMHLFIKFNSYLLFLSQEYLVLWLFLLWETVVSHLWLKLGNCFQATYYSLKEKHMFPIIHLQLK